MHVYGVIHGDTAGDTGMRTRRCAERETNLALARKTMDLFESGARDSSFENAVILLGIDIKWLVVDGQRWIWKGAGEGIWLGGGRGVDVECGRRSTPEVEIDAVQRHDIDWFKYGPMGWGRRE